AFFIFGLSVLSGPVIGNGEHGSEVGRQNKHNPVIPITAGSVGHRRVSDSARKRHPWLGSVKIASSRRSAYVQKGSHR
ncbi:MAG TPA: hypothetical protein VG897_07255, partial [Terriglobales bacterium]|nr:hypothetical protein [Terriglobales bacterium]